MSERTEQQLRLEDWAALRVAERKPSPAAVTPSVLEKGKRSQETRPRLNRKDWSTHELYPMWNSIKQRCVNPRGKSWKDYGGRGIRLCERWMDFRLFEQDLGPRPTKAHQIDRADNDGNYEPGNCRWVTKLEQMSHTRHNHNLEFNGKVLHICEWARQLGVPTSLIKRRLDRGWNVNDILSKPAKAKRFTPEEIALIRESTIGCTKLAMAYDVSKATISKIKLGRIYRHVSK